MTAIAAVVSDGKVWMGGDSAGSNSSWDQMIRADQKVFINGPFLMGFTTSFRMGQLLRWSFDAPTQPEGISDDRFMATTFIDAVRACLKAGGFARKELEVESGGIFLVGYHGQIWQIESDYQVAQTYDLYNAVGSGDMICKGSLFSTQDETSPKARVSLALHAAQRHNAGVRSPFLILREP